MGDTQGDWSLGIDLGTTNTVAAWRSASRAAAEVVQIDGALRMPSAVFLDESGELAVGNAAEHQGRVFPDRLERTPKARLGQNVPMLLGQQAVDPERAVAAVLGAVHSEAIRQRADTAPQTVTLTHPATWQQHRVAALVSAAARAGLESVVTVTEPTAAACFYAGERLAVGEHVAVYDLGGGTFDTAVLTKVAGGFEHAGRPGGLLTAGEDFDERLYRYLGERLPDDYWSDLNTADSRKWQRASLEFRRQVRQAKEALSDFPAHILVPPHFDDELRITRPELEELLKSDLIHTVEILDETVTEAGLSREELAAVYVTGGSSRIPLVTRLIADRYGSAVTTWQDPKSVVALGAANLAARHTRRSGRAPGDVDEPLVASLGRVDSPTDHSRRKRRTLAAALAAVAIVATLTTAAAFAVDRFTRDDVEGERRNQVTTSDDPQPDPTPSALDPITPSDPPTSADPPNPVDDPTTTKEASSGLVAVMPDAFKDTCAPLEQERLTTGSAEAVNCSPSRVGIVQYTKYFSALAMDEDYDFRLENEPAEPLGDQGCSSDSPGAGEWQNSGQTRGRLLCFFDANGVAHIAWTDEEMMIGAWATRDDGDLVELFDWWSVEGSMLG